MIIDQEFKNLIPPLTADERKMLEESILSEGCRDVLITWNGILIDGHNRYEICTEHGLPFQTVEYQFEDRDEAIEWIIRNQFGRRNLPLYERARLALRLKPVIAEKAKDNQRGGQGGLLRQNSDKAIDTKKELAHVAGVSHDTIAKVEKLEALASEEVKDSLRNGTLSINEAYKELKRQQKADAQAERIESIKSAGTVDGNVVCGNCIDAMELLTDESVDCVITDPPYGINYETHRRIIDTEIKKPVLNDGLEDALTTWEKACEILSRKMKPDSHIYVFTSWKVYPQFATITGKYFRIKNCLIWEKNNHGVGDLEGNYSEQYEMILFATKGNRKLNGSRDSNVLNFDKVSSDKLHHLCEKPVNLIEYLIRKSTFEGELVIDPFAGSGSTLVASMNMGRFYWGCEMDSDNYRIMLGRLANGS